MLFIQVTNIRSMPGSSNLDPNLELALRPVHSFIGHFAEIGVWIGLFNWSTSMLQASSAALSQELQTISGSLRVC